MILLQRIKCFFGYHDWKKTGIHRMYGFIFDVRCTHCGKLTEATYEGISFGNIGGQDVMVIQRD